MKAPLAATTASRRRRKEAQAWQILALVSAAHRRRMEFIRAAKFGMELPWAWPYKTLQMLYSNGWR